MQITLYVILINAVRCPDPLHLLDDDQLTVVVPDYYFIPIVGANVSLSCNDSPGLVLTGPNTTTCMDNGQWEPDLKKLKCKGTMHVCMISYHPCIL